MLSWREFIGLVFFSRGVNFNVKEIKIRCQTDKVFITQRSYIQATMHTLKLTCKCKATKSLITNITSNRMRFRL